MRPVRVRLNNEFFIEKIVSHEDETPHRSKTKPRKDSLFFTVRWLGYGPESDTREPWSGLKDTTQLWTYLHRQGLEKLIPKNKRRADGIYDILQLDHGIIIVWKSGDFSPITSVNISSGWLGFLDWVRLPHTPHCNR